MAKRHHLLIAAIVVCASIGIARAIHGPAISESEKSAFSVMTFNVGDAVQRALPVAHTATCILEEGKPDILFLQEMPRGKQGRLLLEALAYPYRSTASSGAGKMKGLMVLSVFPILETREIPLPSRSKGAGALCALIDMGGEKIAAGSVHLDEIEPKPRTPEGDVIFSGLQMAKFLTAEFFSDTIRTESVKDLTVAVLKDAVDMPVIIGGDFNTIPGSRTIRHMASFFHDALWPAADYFAGTYHKVAFPMNPRIDYLFVSDRIEASGGQVVKKSAGDHYPVKASMRLKARG